MRLIKNVIIKGIGDIRELNQFKAITGSKVSTSTPAGGRCMSSRDKLLLWDALLPDIQL